MDRYNDYYKLTEGCPGNESDRVLDMRQVASLKGGDLRGGIHLRLEDDGLEKSRCKKMKPGDAVRCSWLRSFSC
jgi:hypothetical protein